MRVLVLGATGMLGRVVVRVLSEAPGVQVYGTARNTGRLGHAGAQRWTVVPAASATDHTEIVAAFRTARPDVVINCIGAVKQVAGGQDPSWAIPLNSMLPHSLAALCDVASARLVHFSTDCVYSGSKGNYRETDAADATDVYGMSKRLGEIDGNERVLCLRTSIIGHETGRRQGLLEWFLASSGAVKGWRHAVFSGLTTLEVARVLRDVVLPNASLAGLLHLSSSPISKFDLLRLFAAEYQRSVAIEPDDSVRIDRSLDSSRFRSLTGYVGESWPEMVHRMRQEEAAQSPASVES